jgi:hypothetical protein
LLFFQNVFLKKFNINQKMGNVEERLEIKHTSTAIIDGKRSKSLVFGRLLGARRWLFWIDTYRSAQLVYLALCVSTRRTIDLTYPMNMMGKDTPLLLSRLLPNPTDQFSPCICFALKTFMHSAGFKGC